MNANNTALKDQALNRTGGTITGNIQVNAGVTIDGIDVGAVLGGTGTPTFATVAIANAGSSGAPSFARSTDTDTGIYFPGADQIALVAGGGSTTLTWGSTGVVINGNAIINPQGKIPAVTPTYFADLSNLPLLGSTNTFTAANTFSAGLTVSSTSSFTGKPTFTAGSAAPLISGVSGGNFLELTSTGTGATTWIQYLDTSSNFKLYNGSDRLTLSTAGLLTVVGGLTASGGFIQGDFKSSDGSTGDTFTCATITNIGTLTVKDGLIISKTGGC